MHPKSHGLSSHSLLKMLPSKGLRNENRGPRWDFSGQGQSLRELGQVARGREVELFHGSRRSEVVFQPRWFGKISQDIPWEIGNRLREDVLFFWDPSNPSFWRIHHSNHWAKSCAFTSQQYLEQILHHHNGGSFLQRFLKSYLAQVIFYCLFQGFTVAGMARESQHPSHRMSGPYHHEGSANQ